MTGAAPQWVPTDEAVASARVTDFARFVAERAGVRRLRALFPMTSSRLPVCR